MDLGLKFQSHTTEAVQKAIGQVAHILTGISAHQKRLHQVCHPNLPRRLLLSGKLSSLRRNVEPNRLRHINYGKPFKRDISIFRQSGGYTFPIAGRYEIQLVLRLSPKKSLISNIIACEVLRAKPNSKIYVAMQKAFLSEEAVKFLRYKSRIPSRADFLRLKGFADQHKSTPSASAVHYSLGRAMMRLADVETGITRSSRIRKQGLVYLEKAANHHDLGKHRRDRIEQMLTEFNYSPS
jgi:hypothetical protein